MRHRNLAGAGHGSPTDQACITNRVVGGAKRPFLDERLVGWQQPGHAVNFAHLQRLIQRHARQNAGQRFGDERFARSRWPCQQNIVATSGRDFHCPLDMLLPHDVGEIGRILRFVLEQIFDGDGVGGNRP